jgi:hypothetical protein
MTENVIVVIVVRWYGFDVLDRAVRLLPFDLGRLYDRGW